MKALIFLFLTSLACSITPQDYGAAGDAQKVEDAVLNGTTTVTSATAGFVAGDVGKTVYGIENSTGNLYLPRGTITAVVSATQITTSIAAIGGSPNIRLVWGRDDSDEFIAAKNAAVTQRKKLQIPAGGYLLRKRPLGVSYANMTRTIPVEGDGSGITHLYICPDFDYTTAPPWTPLIGGNLGNAVSAKWSGFTIDGCDAKFTHPGGGTNDLFHPIAGFSHSALEDVRIENFKGVGAAVKMYGNCLMTRCHIEDAGTLGLFWYGQGTVLNSYSGNINGVALQVYNVGTNGPFLWLGGIIDECAAPNSVEVVNSKDVHFMGAMLFSGIGRVAVQVDATSEVRFTGSQLTPYGNHWGSALKVLPGGKVGLVNTRLRGAAPGFALEGANSIQSSNLIDGEVKP